MLITKSFASRISRFAVATACVLAVPLVALDGQPGLHDPSTVIAENGKYYVFATGNGLPMSISDDGWTWRRAGGVMFPFIREFKSLSKAIAKFNRI